MKKETLSPGKRRGLISTSDERGIFCVLAFDHRQSFVNMVTGSSSPIERYQAAASMKFEIIQELSCVSTAVLTDPLYGAGQAILGDALPAQTGLIVAVEETGYSGESTARRTTLLNGWGVEKIKRMGADGVKLLIYYHPDGGELTDRQEALVEAIVDECRAFDIPLFLEAVTYSIDPMKEKGSNQYSQERPELIARTAERLSRLHPEVLKLEFPVDAKWEAERRKWEESCKAVSQAASCPWTVLSAAVDFDIFADQVEIACSAGASGFIGGRAIWKEAPGMAAEGRTSWLRTTARERLEKLSKVTHQKGIPWQEFFPAEGIESYRDWYKEY